MDPKIIAAIVIGYLLLKANGVDPLAGLFGGSGGTTGAGGGGTPPAPTGPTQAQLTACSAAGGVWDSVTNMCIPANVITGHSDPTTLAARLITVAHAAGMGTNPVMTIDQWSYYAVNGLQPPLTPPDFGIDGQRDANQQTDAMTALQYAGLFVKHATAKASGVSGVGVSGLTGLGGGNHVLDMQQRGRKWTM